MSKNKSSLLNISPWLLMEEAHFDGSMRVFLFPYAGAAPKVYEGFQKGLPEICEVVIVNLDDPSYNEGDPLPTMTDFCNRLADHMAPYFDKPFAFFGHSAGGMVAYELARTLAMRDMAVPLRLIISGCEPPPFLEPLPAGWDTSEDVMTGILRDWGGVPEELLDDPEVMAPINATMRRHLSLIETLEKHEGSQNVLECSVTLLGGEDDPLVPPSKLEAWRPFFEDAESVMVDSKLFPGNHFYFGGGEAGRDGLMSHLSELMTTDLDRAVQQSQKQIIKWLDRTMEWPEDDLLHLMFMRQAKATPDRVALYYEGRTITYRELDEQSDRLANWLYQQGVRPDSVVAIFMERRIEYVVAYIAALKAGGAYMPLEIVYPIELITRVLEETKCPAVVTVGRFANRLPPDTASVRLDEDSDLAMLQSCPTIPADAPKPTPDSLAYVVMSSGTTGVPKGICCPHRGAVHSYHWRFENFPYEEDERDAVNVFFVWEVLRPLLRGASAYIIPDDIIYDPENMVAFLEKHDITRILVTPSLLQLVLDTLEDEMDLSIALGKLKIVWLCGEVVTMELAQRFIRIAPNCQLLNLYSISECHDVSLANLSVVDDKLTRKFATCGHVFENVQCYILDDNMQPVPNGVYGELFVGGPCLARGYLNRPDLTDARFVPSPFMTRGPETRLYKTGDRGRYLPNGMLELAGRCDFMVKIRGYSVVLGAVEAALAKHPDISTAVVIAHGNEGEDKKLLAYIVPEKWDVQPKPRDIQEFLKDHLPPYAIPPLYMHMYEIPISTMGKVDRKKLPPLELAGRDRAPSISRSERTMSIDTDTDIGLTAPSTEYEKRLVKGWSEVLGLPQDIVYVEDNFFDAGGHSLLITRLQKAINEEFGVKIPLGRLLADPEFGAIASLIHKTLEGSPAGGPAGPKMVDLGVEATFDPSIYPAPTRKTGYSRFRVSETARLPKRVFLTGATGYLGAFLLKELLDSTHCDVYCMVRAADEDAGFDRLRSTLESYDLWTPTLDADRISVVPGDLGKPLLGMDDETFKALAGEIDCILHCGAEVNLVKPYSALRPANVLGTQEIMRLSVTNGRFGTKVKPIHFISTNGVFPTGQPKCLEHDPVMEWEKLSDGYAQTKWVAERMCINARSTSQFPIAIYRPGNMAGDSTSGVWNDHDFVKLLVQGCLASGAFPSDVDWKIDLTPVDWAARTIVSLTTKQPHLSLGQTYHVQNGQAHIACAEVFEWIQRYNAKYGLAPLRAMPYKEWLEEVSAAAQRESNASGPVHQLEAGIDGFKSYLESPSHFDSSMLYSILDESARCPPVDEALMHTFLQRMHDK